MFFLFFHLISQDLSRSTAVSSVCSIFNQVSPAHPISSFVYLCILTLVSLSPHASNPLQCSGFIPPQSTRLLYCLLLLNGFYHGIMAEQQTLCCGNKSSSSISLQTNLWICEIWNSCDCFIYAIYQC